MNVALQTNPAPLKAETKRCILVVDDSRAQRRLLARTLSRWGHRTIEAESGGAALEICRKEQISFVISDWMMPGMSGVEFCRAFREMKGEEPAYFILLTAQTERHVLAEGLESGADDFLSKPFNTVEMKARISAGERILAAQSDLKDKRDLLQETLEELQTLYTAIDRDLQEARNFQQALVPERHYQMPGGCVSMLYEPSGHVGGDLVGLFPISESRFGIYAVDVAGHGVASALMTARIAGLLNPASPERNIALVNSPDGERDMLAPDDVCRALNTLLLAEIETDRYFTMVLADVDFATGRVTMAQAGHPSPAVLRQDGRVEYVSSFGMPIGLIPGAEFTRFDIQLGNGDRLLLHSDGLTECPIDEAGTLLDEDGLKSMLSDLRMERGKDFMDRLHSELGRVSGLAEFPDDLSAVLIERHR